MDQAYTDYRVDGWHLRFPYAWRVSLDEEQHPPQIIFDVEEEPVTVYVSSWHFRRAKTGEAAGAETVRSLMLRALVQQGGRRLEGFSDCCPDGFATGLGQSRTSDGCEMTACFVCAEGCALSLCIVCGEGADFKKYLPYLKLVERE